MNTKEDIKQMMIDVRKAHRLIYQFQDRMLQLMKLIANTYDLSHPAGRKRFSNPVSIMRRGSDYPEANLKVYDKWAWDMLYTYEFEYYFGKSIRNNLAGCLSIFQIADNGYYLADGCFREQEQTDDHISKKEIKIIGHPSNRHLTYCFHLNVSLDPSIDTILSILKNPLSLFLAESPTSYFKNTMAMY